MDSPLSPSTPQTAVVINQSFNQLYPDIRRHLAIIGKRTANQQGESAFSKVTLSSIEVDILEQYISQGIQNVVAAIAPLVSDFEEGVGSVQFRVTNARWSTTPTPNFVNAFEPSFQKYLVMYTVAEYLSMNFPEMSKKYFDAAAQAMDTIVRFVFFKTPPTPATVSYEDINGTTGHPTETPPTPQQPTPSEANPSLPSFP